MTCFFSLCGRPQRRRKNTSCARSSSSPSRWKRSSQCCRKNTEQNKVTHLALAFSFLCFISVLFKFLYSAMLQDKYRIKQGDPSGFGSYPFFYFLLFYILPCCRTNSSTDNRTKQGDLSFFLIPLFQFCLFLFCPLTDFSTSVSLSLIFLTCSSTFLPLICLRLCCSLYLSFLFFNFFSHLTSVGVAWVVLT